MRAILAGGCVAGWVACTWIRHARTKPTWIPLTAKGFLDGAQTVFAVLAGYFLATALWP